MVTRKSYAAPSPAKPLPTVYYRPNGTGRDNYITANSGGFHCSSTGKRVDHYFLDTLRSSSNNNVSRSYPDRIFYFIKIVALSK